MTKRDKKNLLHFITRTGMYINPVDDKNIVSFIHGYQLGTKGKCDFTQLLKQLLSNKYKINYLSDGWPGQVTRMAKKFSLSWVVIFKRIALEVIAKESQNKFDKESREILKTRIVSLIERIEASGSIWRNHNCTEQWLSICSIKSNWLNSIWTDQDWIIIKYIDRLGQSGNVFTEIPVSELIKLRDRYDRITNKNSKK